MANVNVNVNDNFEVNFIAEMLDIDLEAAKKVLAILPEFDADLLTAVEMVEDFLSSQAEEETIFDMSIKFDMSLMSKEVGSFETFYFKDGITERYASDDVEEAEQRAKAS